MAGLAPQLLADLVNDRFAGTTQQRHGGLMTTKAPLTCQMMCEQLAAYSRSVTEQNMRQGCHRGWGNA